MKIGENVKSGEINNNRSVAERNRSVSRRAVVKGAAWSVPVIAAAVSVPAHAAASPGTPCTNTGTINWGTNFTKTGPSTGAGTLTTSTGEVISFVASTVFGASLEPYSQHFNAGGQSAGGDYPLGLMLATHLKDGAVEAPNAARDQRFSVVTTFTFDKPISNLQFTIWDIDSARTPDGSQLIYREYVKVDGAPTPTLGSRLQFDSDGWVVSKDWVDIVPGNPDYAATFQLAGPTQTLVVRMNRPMTTNQRPDSYGAIYLANVTFTRPCPTP